MLFYSGKLILHPAMENPTLVLITDRNDLDDQLFGTFGRCHELLRQERSKPTIVVTSADYFRSPPVELFSPRSRSSFPRRRGIVIRCFLTGGTSLL